MSDCDGFVVAALYKFAKIPNPELIRDPLLQRCKELAIKGTLLLAREGMNGTISGSQTAIDSILDYIRNDNLFQGNFINLEVKFSLHTTQPFLKMKVRLKKEIVTLGVPHIDPTESVGQYVEPKDWNELISDPDTIVVDTRNQYEIDVGTFRSAVNPETQSFKQFPDFIHKLDKDRKIAMFCTGGIRCEKSTSLLRRNGFNNVYHLRGGILKYFEEVETSESLFEGECFVFDERITVDQNLEKGTYSKCYACRKPISKQQMESPLYEVGVSCPLCHEQCDKQTKRFRERQRQMELAEARGTTHLGSSLHR